jgi:hypothetical protein
MSESFLPPATILQNNQFNPSLFTSNDVPITLNTAIQITFVPKVYKIEQFSDTIFFDCSNLRKKSFSAILSKNIKNLIFVNTQENGEYFVHCKPVDQITIDKKSCINNLYGNTIFTEIFLIKTTITIFGNLVQFETFN